MRAPQLPTRVNPLFGRTEADVVQGGVQLMTLGTRVRDWFKVQLAEQLPKARVIDPVPLRLYEV